MRIIFFGTSEFAVPILRILVQHHEVVLVVAEKAKAVGRKKIITSSPVERLAQGLNLKIITPESIKSPLAMAEILSHQPDINIVVAYGKIIPPEIFNLSPHKTINIHPSLLPKLRGPSPIQTALRLGLKETGVSLIVMDDEIDHGPVVSQETIAIDRDDNYFDLESKLSELAAKMLIRDLSRYAKGELKPQEQNHSQAIFTKMIKKEDGRVDWSKSADEIYNQWCAFIKWPGIYTFFTHSTSSGLAFWRSDLQKEIGSPLIRLKLISIEKTNHEYKYSPGTVFLSENNELLIACSNGAIQPLRLQPESKKILSTEEFLNGYGKIIGQRLS